MVSLRATYRLLLFLVVNVICLGIGTVLLFSYGRGTRSWLRTIARWERIWAATLCRVVHLRVRVEGNPPKPAARKAGGVMVVSNHVSYVDVVALGSIYPGFFIAKRDVQDWPLLGPLARLGGTLFIERVSKRRGVGDVGKLTKALLAGRTMTGFPEGTSTDGSRMRPFKTAVFQAPVEAQCPVIPVAIRYVSVGTASDGAEARRKVAWFGEETFVPHLLQLLTCPYIEVRVSFGEPILPPHTDRRSLSAEAERQVRALGNLPFMEVAKEPEEPDEPVIEDAGCGVG